MNFDALKTELNIIPGYEGRYAITSDGQVYCYGERKKWLKPSLDKRARAG